MQSTKGVLQGDASQCYCNTYKTDEYKINIQMRVNIGNFGSFSWGIEMSKKDINILANCIIWVRDS